MIKNDSIHPGSLLIIQLYKAQGTLVWWNIGHENRLLVSTALDAIWSGYSQLCNFWGEP